MNLFYITLCYDRLKYFKIVELYKTSQDNDKNKKKYDVISWMLIFTLAPILAHDPIHPSMSKLAPARTQKQMNNTKCTLQLKRGLFSYFYIIFYKNYVKSYAQKEISKQGQIYTKEISKQVQIYTRGSARKKCSAQNMCK